MNCVDTDGLPTVEGKEYLCYTGIEYVVLYYDWMVGQFSLSVLKHHTI